MNLHKPQTFALSEVAQIKQGGRLKLSGKDFVENGFPAFGAGGINGHVSVAEFRQDAVVLSAIGARCGKCFLAEGAWTSLANTQIILPDLRRADVRYLWYQLNDETRWPRSGVAQPFIKPAHVKEHKVRLPPLPEQKRIAAILDQADALRRLRRRALDRLNTLGQAIFQEMFGDPRLNTRGWRQRPLGEVADFYSGNSLPDGEVFQGQVGGSLLLKVSDLNREENQREIVAAASWSPVPGSRASTCPAGSVVFPKRGGAIGTNKKRILGRSTVLDPNLMGVTPNAGVLDSEYLFAWFETFDLSDISSGSSVPQLNKKDLIPLRISVPPFDLQKAFSDRRRPLLRLHATCHDAVDHQEALFNNLQHRAFTGQL